MDVPLSGNAGPHASCFNRRMLDDIVIDAGSAIAMAAGGAEH